MFKAALRIMLLAALGVGIPTSVSSQSRLGPGLPKTAFREDETFKTLSVFKSATDKGEPRGHGNVAMVNGYMFMVYAADGDLDGGLSFWDIGDPRNPKLVLKKDVFELREAHGFGFSNSQGGDYVVLQAQDGVQFWDFTDVRQPKLLKYWKCLVEQASNYEGIWWISWQAPYLFMGATQGGLLVADASDIQNPVIIKSIPTPQTGGFRLGPTFAVGNRLVTTNMAVDPNPGISMFDISDPRNPVLLSTKTDHVTAYSTFFNGNKVYAAGLDGALHVFDASPGQLKFQGKSDTVGNRGEYLHTQDNFVHMGVEAEYVKIDLNDFSVKGRYSLPHIEAQEGFCVPLGHLTMVTDDHAEGSALVAHEREPDTRPPLVNMQSPEPLATRQALTSRIGMTFTDQIELSSVGPASLIVRTSGGKVLTGKYSTQTNIVNFSPDIPLEANTTYEVLVAKGGIKDYAGNAVATDVIWSFSTGATVIPPSAGIAMADLKQVAIKAQWVPGSARASIRVSGLPRAASRAKVSLYSLGGRLVYEGEVRPIGGEARFPVDIGSAGRGSLVSLVARIEVGGTRIQRTLQLPVQ